MTQALTTGVAGRSVSAHKGAPDSVRALSALVVVVSHAIQIVWYPAIGLGTWTHRTTSFVSETAVIIFFLLSGYLISASIDANIVRRRWFDLSDYALNRVVRIYPPLLFAVALSAALFCVMLVGGWPGVATKLAFDGDLYTARDIVTLTGRDLLDAVTMRDGLLLINGALWSLYVEVKLYAAAGLLAFAVFGAPHIVLRVAIVAAVFWVADSWSLTLPRVHWVYGVWWISGAAMFLIGRFPRMHFAVGAGALGAMATGIVGLTPTSALLEAARVCFVFTLGHAMFFRWTWSEPITKAIAGYSYTLYLIHFPVLIFAYSCFVHFAGPVAPSPIWRVAVMAGGVAISVLCAWRAATLVEDTYRIKRALRVRTA